MGSFVEYVGKDTVGYDYQYIPNLSLNEMKAIASMNPMCIGFTSNGFFKFNVKTPSEWMEKADVTLYVNWDRYRQLSSVKPPSGEIPKIFHFIWFSKGRPFNMIHYLTMKSAQELHPGYLIKLHCDAPPPENNFFFNKIKPFIVVNIIKPVEVLNNNYVYHFQHKADILRLDVLYEEGGIYSDIDNLFLKSLDGFRNIPEGLMLSHDRKEKKSLANGLIMATPKHPVIKEWREIYQTTWGTDLVINWYGHSTILPYELGLKYPHLINMQPSELFCPYLWNEFQIFQTKEPLIHPDAYNIQLFETELSKTDILQDDVFYFINNNNRFTILFKHYIEEFSEFQELTKLMEKYTFFSQKDAYYNDITQVAHGSVYELLSEADKIPNCLAVNSNGWVKHFCPAPDKLQYEGSFKWYQGIFVKTELVKKYQNMDKS